MSVQAALELDHAVVECGGAVVGTVSWRGNQRHQVVGVVLRYWAEGPGRHDATMAVTCTFGPKEAGTGRFRLDVPPGGPVTYHGRLIQLFWQVAVQVPADKRFYRLDTGPAVAELTVVPAGWSRLGGRPVT